MKVLLHIYNLSAFGGMKIIAMEDIRNGGFCKERNNKKKRERNQSRSKNLRDRNSSTTKHRHGCSCGFVKKKAEDTAVIMRGIDKMYLAASDKQPSEHQWGPQPLAHLPPIRGKARLLPMVPTFQDAPRIPALADGSPTHTQES